MARLIAVGGASSSGKSSSISTLEPKETFIFSVANKPLPFKGIKKKYTRFLDNKETGNLLNTSNPDSIIKVLNFINLKRPEILNVVIDDMQYITVFETFSRSAEKGFEKWSQIAANFYNIVAAARDMRDDLNIIFMMHTDTDEVEALGTAKITLKTGSKSIKNNLVLEGLMTYVFITNVTADENGVAQYEFDTNDGIKNVAKTPRGCFSEKYVPNDLALVLNRIKEYEEED